MWFHTIYTKTAPSPIWQVQRDAYYALVRWLPELTTRRCAGDGTRATLNATAAKLFPFNRRSLEPFPSEYHRHHQRPPPPNSGMS